MTQSAVTQTAGAGGRAAAGQPAPGQAPPWWHVTWSAPAAMRAARATIVIPVLFAISLKVIGNSQMTIFATFGSFGALVMTSFGGTRRDKLVAHLGLAVAGSVALTIGTLVSGSAWLAAIVTVPVAFAIYFGGSAGPNAASGVTACLLAYILPVASVGTSGMIGWRLAGWWLASVVSTAAVLLMSPRSPGDRLRAQTASLAAALARQLDDGLAGRATEADRAASVAAKHELMNAFVSTPYRPIGLASADQGLASVIHLLEWCTSLINDVADGHLDLPATVPEDKELLTLSARALQQVAALLSGRPAEPDLAQIWHARLASARHLQRLTDEPELAVLRADYAFHAQTIGIATSAAVVEAMVAAGRASPAEVGMQRRNWLSAPVEPPSPEEAADPPGQPEPARPALAWLPIPARAAGIIATDASLRSVWFRNGARGAVALAAAVAVAKLTDVQHAFWVALGTLSVLRTSAAATGSTAVRALAGTVAGFVVGAALLLAIGTNPVALWVVFPLAVLVAAYTPGTAPFVAGQAAFTVTVVVLFNLIVPAGWKVGLLRVEDVAIGCGVSLVVGLLFWPRGASGVVGDNLADAFRSGASYLSDAVSWALGDRAYRPERALAAIAAGTRLDDALRGYLTEQGSKRLAKADLWTLVMAAMRLRLTAHSVASLPGTGPHPSDSPPHATLERQSAELTGFYDGLADIVAKPGRNGQPPVRAALPPTAGYLSAAADLRDKDGSAGYRADALWVGHHLSHLAAHTPGLTEPAERLARIRRRPWWR
ncbi:MAG: FUSC family protein [Streptosporangiaceae bacterium]